MSSEIRRGRGAARPSLDRGLATKGAVLTFACLGFSVQQALIVPAIPALRSEMHTSTAWATWLLTGFLISAAVAIPILSRLGDQFGRRRLLIVSLVIFFAGSVAAALAWDITSLIVFRVLQGAGGASLPLATAIVLDEFPTERAGSMVSLISSVFGIGGVVGLVIAGPIVDGLSWRVLFVLGAAVSGTSALLVWRFVSPTPRSRLKRATLDWPGAALFAAGLLCFMVGLTEGSKLGWGSPAIVGLLVAAAVLLAAWVLVELRLPSPMVDVRLLARPELLFPNLTTVFLGMVIFGISLLIPTLAQTPRHLAGGVAGGFGASVTQVGLYFLANSVALLVAPAFVGLRGRGDNLRFMLSAGMLSSAIGCCGLAVWHSEPWQVVVFLVFFGAGTGLGLASVPRIVLSAVPSTETAVATGVNMVARMSGGVIGAQAVAAILSSQVVAGTTYSASHGFGLCFWFLTVVGLAGAATALLPRARKASSVTAALSEA